MSTQPLSDELHAALKRAGITRSFQTLLWVPKRYEDYTIIVNGSNYWEYVGKKVCIELIIASKPAYRDKGQFTVVAEDDSGTTHKLILFGILRFSPWASLQKGDHVWVRAKVVDVGGRQYLNNIELITPERLGRVTPVYTARQGVIGAEKISQAITCAMASEQNISDAALAVREAFGGMEEKEIIDLAGCGGSLNLLIRNLHAPAHREAAEWALDSAKCIAAAYIRWSAKKSCARPLMMKSVIRIPTDNIRKLLAGLPWALTRGAKSQISAIKEILDALAEPYPMDALLSADVGAGKTVCYGLVAALAQEQGHRVAILIPNTILVNQVVNELRAFFPNIPIIEVSEKENHKTINWNENPILVGTTRLFGIADRAKWVPDLLVVDEQQKTDEQQRLRLCAAHTNTLETTATPLPRSLAMLVHGGKRLIQVSAQHAKKHIRTRIVDQQHKREVFEQIAQRVANGDQAAIIYPRVEASTGSGKKSVIDAAKIWEQRFPGKVAVLHGKLKDDEKRTIMSEVKSGEKPIIIASSIVEVGVTIPDLRLMMVVHAERYGVYTLHQFRGRLARLGGEGDFLLYLPDEVEEETMERLRLLEKTTDGFALAELDMQMRGFGDLAEASGAQSGKTRTLFTGIQLMPSDLEEKEAA